VSQAFNKAIVDSRFCPQCATHSEYLLHCWLLSKLWLETWLWCLSYSVAG